MAVPEVTISLGGILAATLVSMVVGMLWYSPVLFGKRWLEEIGKTHEELGSPAPAMIGSVLMSVLMFYVLAHALSYNGAETVLEAIATGFFLWLGFIFATHMVRQLYEGDSWTVFGIFLGFQLVTMVLGSILLVSIDAFSVTY